MFTMTGPVMRSLRTLVAMLVVCGGFQPAVAQQGKCYEWSDAAPIVRREKLMSAKDVHEQARRRFDGELIRITLCEEKGQFVYKLVLQDGGKVRYLTVDARAPF